MNMEDAFEIPRDEDISFYEDTHVYHHKPGRQKSTPYKPVSAKKVAKKLFNIYSEMTVDIPMWNEKEDLSWENSSTESEQANLISSFQIRSPFHSDVPGYVFGPKLIIRFIITTMFYLTFKHNRTVVY